LKFEIDILLTGLVAEDIFQSLCIRAHNIKASASHVRKAAHPSDL